MSTPFYQESMTLAEQKLDSNALKSTVQLHSLESLPPKSLPLPPCVGQSSNSSQQRSMEEIDYESLPTENLSTHLCAGAAAGMMEHCFMYPVDCVKTRMMMLNPNHQARYKSIFRAFHTIVTKENPRALFRGIGVVATGAGPAHAIYFACYELSKKWLSGGRRSTVLSQGGAGIISSLLHDGFMNPIDVIKQRLQMYNSPYKGAFNCARTIFEMEGIRAFYRSYTTQLSMNIPFQVTHFISYEYLQDHLNYERHYNPISHVLSGAGAGMVAAFITNPLDVAKTLLNTRTQHRMLSSEKKITGMLSAVVAIFRTVGMKGYFRGVTARVFYQMPSTAICWSVYEFFKHVLGMKTAPNDCSSSDAQPPS